MFGSDDHPSDSHGWNYEWFGSSPFPNPDADFSPPLQTQGSLIPGGCRPYPVDEQDAEGPYGWDPETCTGGSTPMPPEGGSAAPPRPRSVRVRTRGSTGGDTNVRTPYTLREMQKLFKAYMEISEDAETGTNQTEERFWWRVSRHYNDNRPDDNIELNESMVCNAIGRANKEIQKIQGYLPLGTAVGRERHERG